MSIHPDNDVRAITADRVRLKALNAELLAVLSAVVDDCDHEQDRHNRARFHSSRMARAAIAKARGDAPVDPIDPDLTPGFE